MYTKQCLFVFELEVMFFPTQLSTLSRVAHCTHASGQGKHVSWWWSAARVVSYSAVPSGLLWNSSLKQNMYLGGPLLLFHTYQQYVYFSLIHVYY